VKYFIRATFGPLFQWGAPQHEFGPWELPSASDPSLVTWCRAMSATPNVARVELWNLFPPGTEPGIFGPDGGWAFRTYEHGQMINAGI